MAITEFELFVDKTVIKGYQSYKERQAAYTSAFQKESKYARRLITMKTSAHRTEIRSVCGTSGQVTAPEN